MIRTLLTAILITLFSQTAWAEVVYFCNVNQHITIDGQKLDRYKPHRFKMMVSARDKKVKFAGGALDKMSFEFKNFWKKNDWYAKGSYAIIQFEGRRFEYVSITSDITAFSAECDTF